MGWLSACPWNKWRRFYLFFNHPCCKVMIQLTQNYRIDTELISMPLKLPSNTSSFTVQTKWVLVNSREISIEIINVFQMKSLSVNHGYVMIGKIRSILKHTLLSLTENIQRSVSLPFKWSLLILNHIFLISLNNVYPVVAKVKIQIQCILFISKHMITINWLFSALYTIYNLYKENRGMTAHSIPSWKKNNFEFICYQLNPFIYIIIRICNAQFLTIFSFKYIKQMMRKKNIALNFVDIEPIT